MKRGNEGENRQQLVVDDKLLVLKTQLITSILEVVFGVNTPDSAKISKDEFL